ncbi:MAG: hypothetical protein HYU56_04825 [Candidatus Aenigmarchaeota archaeon]|nr:hypothetical protein [Candidatus Aenigmarchaeota archaeon]
MANLARGLGAGAREFTRTYNGMNRWFRAVESSLPRGSDVRRSIDGSYYVIKDGLCGGTFGYGKGPEYSARTPEFEETFKAAEARRQDKTVLLSDAKIRKMIRGAQKFMEGYRWFSMLAAEAPRHGYRLERSNHGGYALFRGDVDVAVIGFGRRPLYTAYSPIAEDFLEAVKSKWKARKEQD